MESKIVVIDENKDGSIDDMEVKKAEMTSRHRDGVWRLFGRLTDTISVFTYQGFVFYVQLEVYRNQSICEEGNGCKLEPPKNSMMVWLYIEIYCFYLYLASTIFYIAYHQLVSGVCCKK